MEQKTFIFIGKSGSGKGTQAELLKSYLEKNDSRPVVYLETGGELRKLVKAGGYTGGLTKKIIEVGGLMPEFLPVYLWSKLFLDNLKGDEHIITDGMPRKLQEALILDGALNFYHREKPTVVYLDVSTDSVIDRLQKRGRETGRTDDSSIETIKNRLAYFEKDVAPVVDYYRQNSNYNFLHIDGEPSVETIHESIMSKVEFGN
ncbi:MAG: nucleoside monophosphate kinase [Candidatus Vogelbacteria bacterium]|nr:nucleoside monophosphate kinase [Candidatus Vogelbacteria bacterium]